MTPVAAAVVVVLAGALAVGLTARRRLARGRDRERDQGHPLVEGLSVGELVVPARTLAALVLAFAVVTVHGSFQDVGRQAATEAGAVLSMGEESLLLTPEARGEVLGGLRCYARSVVEEDWPAQADGAPSPRTDAAADRLTLALDRAAADSRNATAASAILDGNAQRTQVRLQRVEDGRPSVPPVVWALLLLTLATVICGLGALVRPGVRGTVHLAILAATTLVFGFALLVVDDLDRPYSGFARIEPTAMLLVEQRLATLPTAPAAVPCEAPAGGG